MMWCGVDKHFIRDRFKKNYSEKKNYYPRNRPWKPIGLWDVEDTTLSRQSAHRWRWGSALYAGCTLFPRNIFFFWYSFLLEDK
jgi:hypothetical protein